MTFDTETHYNIDTGAPLACAKGEIQWKPMPGWQGFKVRISEFIPTDGLKYMLPFAYGNIYTSTGRFTYDDIVIHTVSKNQPWNPATRFKERVHTTIMDYIYANVTFGASVPRSLEEYVEIQPLEYGGHWISLKDYIVFVLDEPDRFPAFATTHPKPAPRENAIPVPFPRVPGGVNYGDEPEELEDPDPLFRPGPNGVVPRAMAEGVLNVQDTLEMPTTHTMSERAKEMRRLCRELTEDDPEEEYDAVSAFATAAEASEPMVLELPSSGLLPHKYGVEIYDGEDIKFDVDQFEDAFINRESKNLTVTEIMEQFGPGIPEGYTFDPEVFSQEFENSYLNPKNYWDELTLAEVMRSFGPQPPNPTTDSMVTELPCSGPARREKQLPEWKEWEEAQKSNKDIFKFPPAGIYWAPERTVVYEKLVKILTDYAINDGPKPTPAQLNTWEWVASRDAEMVWFQIKTHKGLKD